MSPISYLLILNLKTKRLYSAIPKLVDRQADRHENRLTKKKRFNNPLSNVTTWHDFNMIMSQVMSSQWLSLVFVHFVVHKLGP